MQFSAVQFSAVQCSTVQCSNTTNGSFKLKHHPVTCQASVSVLYSVHTIFRSIIHSTMRNIFGNGPHLGKIRTIFFLQSGGATW